MSVFIEQIKTRFHDQIAQQKPQAILFVPVFMALGIGAYFLLRAEPAVIWAPMALILFAGGALGLRGGLRFLCFALMLCALGFGAAQLRTHNKYTPILAKKMKFADVEGRIESTEVLDKGARLVLDDVVIEDLAPEKTPRKVRLKTWKGEALQVGQRVSVLAGLNPPSPPVMPRGFDFQRYMFFKGIGAVGFIYKEPVVLEEGGGESFVEGLRQKIGERIGRSLEAPQSGLARALMVGQRSAIGEDDIEAIRDAGLAHMLAISGLHIGLFSGVLFFVARFLMALRPSFALRHPIKKYAAVIAIGGAFFYMMIAGASIPAQRAMISVTVFFVAVMLDRSAISLRVVAFAAFVVLLIFPESLTSVSFQMSFAAVAALVAFYDWLRPLWSAWHRQAGALRRAGLYLAGVSFTTVVASLATAPFALFHFQHLAVYSLLSNLICVPILGFIIMPAAVLSLFLMPFGLEGIGFAVMEPALQAMLKISHYTAAMEGAVLHVPQWGFHTLLLCVAVGLSLVLLRGHLRVITAGVCGLVLLLTFQVKQPDIMVSSNSDLVVIRGSEPYLHVSSRKKERFTRENWERAMGYTEGDSRAFPREGSFEDDERISSGACGEAGCRFEMKGRKIAYLRSEDAVTAAEDCAWADIVLSKQAIKGGCGAAVVLDKFDVYRHGAHSLYLDDPIKIERVEDFRGKRAWNPKYQ